MALAKIDDGVYVNPLHVVGVAGDLESETVFVALSTGKKIDVEMPQEHIDLYCTEQGCNERKEWAFGAEVRIHTREEAFEIFLQEIAESFDV